MTITTTNKDGTTTPTKSSQPLRIGFLGAATICKKNSKAIYNISSNCKFTALASRSKEKAQTFIQTCIENNSLGDENDVIIFESYDDLVNSQNVVDAIYVPLPTTLHKEWVIKSLQAKKHVLLEKPTALSKEDLQTMIETAKTHSKYLMDGTMFIHNTRTNKFLNSIKSTTIQEIKSEFTFMGYESFWKNNIRLLKDCDPFGCIGDLGWYCIRIALIVMKGCGKYPSSVQVTNFKCNDDGVPIDATCLVHFDGIPCSFHCSFLQEKTDFVELYDANSKLIAKINQFVLPPNNDTSTFELIQTNHVETCGTNNLPYQEVEMWRNFARIARSVDDVGRWNDEALDMVQVSFMNQKVIDALMESMSCDGKVVNI